MGLINRDIPAPPVRPLPSDGRSVRALLRYARARDPIGHEVHTCIAALYLFTLPQATAVKDITFGLLLLYVLLRLPNIWRCYAGLLGDWFLTAFLLWLVVFGISVLWSADPAQGLDQWGAFRVIMIPIALWPVLDRTPWLIGALLLGVFGLNLHQLGQVLEVGGLETSGQSRARGGLHPIQTAAFNLAALTWYFAALVRWRPTANARGTILMMLLIAGAISAVFGLLFSGSRGAWFAALIVLPTAAAWLVIRDHSAWRRTGVACLLFAAAGAAMGIAGGGRYVAERLDLAAQEYRDAVENGNYMTSIGQRVVMTRWALRFFEEDPLFGKGAGSFRELSKQTPEFQAMAERAPGRAERNRFTPAHPHSTYLHVLADTGILGLVPFAATLVILLILTLKEPRDHLFAGAAMPVLIGWMIGTQFDCYHLNGHLFGLFAFIGAIVLHRRARVGAEKEEEDD